jgi:hypothetical protein
VQNNEMAETVTCSKSVLLKLKTMYKSTHIKQDKRWLKEIGLISHAHQNKFD